MRSVWVRSGMRSVPSDQVCLAMRRSYAECLGQVRYAERPVRSGMPSYAEELCGVSGSGQVCGASRQRPQRP
jgi:hypothetical protein